MENKKSPVRTFFILHRETILEAPPRFELGHRGFADLCLTTWLWRRIELYSLSVKKMPIKFNWH